VLWYAGYGSNLDRDRFLRYLHGGAAPGAQRVLSGARDATPPADERALTFAATMFFAWESPTWGGGIAFVDVDGEDTTYARAYLLTEEQFSDVAVQEMHREPGTDLDLAHVLERRRHTYGPGRYETLHHLGELDGHPVLTFTAESRDALPPNQPRADYLRCLARGLRATHGLTEEAVVDYLLARPGMGSWTAGQLTDLVVDTSRDLGPE
jgi:hypothetical protein